MDAVWRSRIAAQSPLAIHTTSVDITVKCRYPCDGFDSGTCVTLSGRGVEASGSSGRVRKGAVFFGRVVSGCVATDDTSVLGDLDGVSYDPHLDLLASHCVPDPIRGGSETDVP